MKIFDMPQMSPEWYEIRRGIATASNFDRILTPKTGKLSAKSDEYICELIAEKHCQPRDEGPISRAMAHGLDCEPEARRYYEFATDSEVRQVGFCLADDGRIGCSPDGLVGEEGGLELKCPLPKTHVTYLLAGVLPDDYKGQVHGSLIVTGRKWWDFVSYAPGLPAFKIRVTPTDYTEMLRVALEAFWARYAEIEKRIAEMQP